MVPASIVLFLLTLVACSESEDVETSKFLVPAMYSYGQCSEVPYPQTLDIHLTTQLGDDKSRAVIFGTGKSTSGLLWARNKDNTIRNVFSYPLIQLHHQVERGRFCMNRYCLEEPTEEIIEASNGMCYDRDATSGVYAKIEQDRTVSFIVGNKGPDFMHVYPALPLDGGQNVTYYVLNPTHYPDRYFQAFALRAGPGNDTDVTIYPTQTVKVFRPRSSKLAPPDVINMDIVIVEAYDELSLTLNPLETAWVEVVTESCNSGVSLSGTRVDSARDLAVYSVQALCSETQEFILDGIKIEDLSSLTNESFNTIVSPVRQLPPTYKWGAHFITDLKRLRTVSEAVEMRYWVLSFSIISSGESEVSIKCHGAGVFLCNAAQFLGEGEIWHYQLQLKSMLEADAISIRGSRPIMVLHEIYSQERNRAYHSELLQPVEWFSVEQPIPIFHSLDSQQQNFFITLVIPGEPVTIEQVFITDDKGNDRPTTIGDYGLAKHHSSLRIEEHTVIHLEVDSEQLNGSDIVVQFSVNSTYNAHTVFGASIFSYGGYAFSNGYILDDNITSHSIKEGSFNFSSVIGGAVSGSLAILLLVVLTLVLLVVCHKKGMSFLPWLPPPPSKDFEFDAFLSFADEDRDFAQKVLHQPLAQRGYRVLLHLTDFIAGMTIEDNIIRAVNVSRVVIFVCSKHFSKSSFCQTELKHGMESHYGKYRGRYRRVIPVVIEGECPAQLNTYRIRPIPAPNNIWNYDKRDIAELLKALNLGKPMELSEDSFEEESTQLA